MDSQLEQLLGIWLNDDEASEETLAALLDRLREDDDFKQNFVDELTMQGKLRAVQASEPRWLKLNDRLRRGGGSEDEVEDFEKSLMNRVSQFVSDKSRAQSLRKNRRICTILAATAVGVSVIWLGLSFFGNKEDSMEAAPLVHGNQTESLPPNQSGEFVAMLSRTAEAEWGNDEQLIRGANLPVGELDLRSGLAQIDFYGGAHLIVEGPSTIEILSDRNVFLKSGKATCYVSELGRGFQVSTVDGEILDLGTAFALEASEQGFTAVHVIEGSVSILNEIIEAKSAKLVKARALTAIPFAPDQFPRPNEFVLREKERDTFRFNNWQIQSELISIDPDTLLHYTMEGQDRSGPEVVNQVLNNTTGRATNGTILGTSWTDGRWRGKSALRFSNEEDRLLARIPGAYDQVTFLIWAKVDALTQTRTAFILAHGPARWSLKGSISQPVLADAMQRRSLSEIETMRWTAFQPTGAMHFNLAFENGPRKPGLDWAQYQSLPNIITSSRWGSWGCYGVTYDAVKKQVIHYLNGEESGISKLGRPEHLLLDFLEIGNLSIPKDNTATKAKYRFYGVMDEIVIAKRVFSPVQMKAIFQMGMP